MALADDIILQRGKLLVTPGVTGYSIYAIPGTKSLNFGTVALTCELSDVAAVGQTVMFDMDKVEQRFAIGSTMYYKIDENNIFLSETQIM